MWVHDYGSAGSLQVDSTRTTYLLEAASIPSLLIAKKVKCGIDLLRDGCTMELDPRASTDSKERYKAMCYVYGAVNHAKHMVSHDGIVWKTVKNEYDQQDWQLAKGPDNCLKPYPDPTLTLTPVRWEPTPSVRDTF